MNSKCQSYSSSRDVIPMNERLPENCGFESRAAENLLKQQPRGENLARMPAALRRSFGPEPVQGAGRDKPVIVGGSCVDPGPHPVISIMIRPESNSIDRTH